MSKSWQPYAWHILDSIARIKRINILVHNYLGNLDALTVAMVIDNHLQPLEECIRAMLATDT